MSTVRTMRIARAAIAIVCAAALLGVIPLAAANHLTTSYTKIGDDPIDPGMGWVWEDDEAVIHQPGTNLDGLTNKVVHEGDGIGLGELILDTHYYYSFNPVLGFPDMLYMSGVTQSRHVYPGVGHFIAWHGWWNDLNENGRFDDWHDASPNHKDEFKWRGAATGESVTMVLFTIPTNIGNLGGATGTALRTTPGAWHNESNPNAMGQFSDRTGLQESQQKWVTGGGWGTTWYDEGLITTFQTLTVANATRVAGSDQIVDVEDERALRDVDVYESLEPGLEGLWLSTVRLARDEYYTPTITVVNAAIAQAVGIANGGIDAVLEARDHVRDNVTGPIVNPIIGDILAVVDPYVDEVLDVYGNADEERLEQQYRVNRALSP